MSTPIDNGGPAFPDVVKASHGMSLRDYFSAKALAGMIASEIDGNGMMPSNEPIESWLFRTTKKAYEYADAMLAARKETK